MCGIAGIYSPQKKLDKNDLSVVSRINDIQKHRGPDDSGIYQSQYCILGHRRLSIIDLSEAGHQPFVSHDKRYYLTFNGEIYNYIELRKELKSKGYVFKTKTDIEVLLNAYIAFGHDCLHKFNGMFAFSIYDTIENTLFAARDRIGIKPFYYTFFQDKFFFASEIKGLRTIHPQYSANHQTFFDYLVFNRTDIFDETFVKEIKRLPKGHFIFFDKNGMQIHQYWNPENFLNSGQNSNIHSIKHDIENLLVTSVKLRMRSDVEVGSCLSGGLDSTIIAGILFQYKMVNNGYKTFTASFPNHPIDETTYIDDLNKNYNFNNYRIFPVATDAFSELKTFVYQNDEPTTNSSFYSQYQVMRLAKEHGVTVLLDGQGGDESFAGYQYFHGFYMYGLLKQNKYSAFVIELVKNTIRKQDKSAYQTLLFQLLPDKFRKKALLKTLPHISKDFFYSHIDKSLIYNNFFNVNNLNTSLVRHFQYKLEHLLRMEDRNSMAFSIEARVPYLDHRFIEYCLGIPENLKIKNGETKLLQKESVGKYTVASIRNRKDKIGFGTPRDEWMQTPEWRELTDSNYRFLQNSYSGIFNKKVHLPVVGFERWKINQLATWKNTEWNKK